MKTAEHSAKNGLPAQKKVYRRKAHEASDHRALFQPAQTTVLPLTLHLRKCIAAALEAEHVNVPCEINVLVTDDAGIRAINRATRNIDRETDVLSFPMFQFTPGQFPEDVQEDIDPQTGLLPLGDMAISLERAQDQAKRFGNSLTPRDRAI